MECGFDTHKNALIKNLVILFAFFCAVEPIYSFFKPIGFFDLISFWGRSTNITYNAFLTDFAPSRLSQSVTMVKKPPTPPPPRNVTLVCRPDLKPVYDKDVLSYKWSATLWLRLYKIQKYVQTNISRQRNV